MICRVATINDLPQLVALGEIFCKESGWGWTYSEENATRTFYTSIIHPETDTLLIEEKGELLGAALVAVENDFQVETVGDIIEFYMSPKSRGTGASRELMQYMCDWFNGHKAVNVFVKSTANIGEGKAFENLFAKYGFKVFSHVLVR